MQCPQCHAEIPADAFFCDECGSRLETTCASCGEANRLRSKFCKKCGQSLTTAETSSTSPPDPHTHTPKHLAEKILTSKSALQGERKHVTVLFADLKGSMEFLADRDPEESRTLLNAVVERMMEAVHRYEGTVNNVMGDGIMAIFGAPLAHEDHALRACYAGLAMQESIRAYSNEVRRSYGVEMHIRAGLNSGEVVVGDIGNDLHMDYNAVGQTTHMAARMEQLALPGSIRLTADTLRLVEGFVQVNPLGPMPVKGVAGPVEVFELVGADATHKRLQTATTRGLTQFVGRQGELESLGQASEKAHSGHGQVVAVVGEAGVGKSRLFWEFTHSHHMREWLILESGSVSYGKATPYLPVIDLLKIYFQVEDRDDQRKVREKVTGKLLTLDEALRSTLPALLTLFDVPVEDSQWRALDPTQRRRKTLDAVKTLFLRESQVQPLCLVFEDLHWIDSETQAFMDDLVESLPTTQVLLLVNYRPEYQHGWGNKTYYTQLRVDPLSFGSANELLQAMVGDSAELASLRPLLIERTQGNPFFLEETVRALVETGVLTGERGEYRLAKPLEGITVPATVQAILAARIDRLPREEKRLLQTAAVLGKDFSFALLEAIAEEPGADLYSSITRLQAAEFLYETQLFPELEYTFRHALTHEVAYGTLLHERRRILHRRTVEAIERLYPDELVEQVERLAYHAFQGELWAKAASYLHQAGTKTAGRSASHEAVTYFEQALVALAHLPESHETLRQTIDIRVELGPVLLATKGAGAPEVESSYNNARELCERIGETSRLFPVLWGLWHSNVAQSRLTAARKLGERLLEVAQHEQDASLLLEAHHSLWPTLMACGELSEAKHHLDQGLELYDVEQHRGHAFLYGGHDPGVCCRWFSAIALWRLGYPDQALRRARDAVNLARDLSHSLSIALALFHAGWTHYNRGEHRDAVEHARAATEMGKDQGLPVVRTLAAGLMGRLMVVEGHYEEGIAQLSDSVARFSKGRGGGRRSFLISLLAETWKERRQTEDGLELLTNELGRDEDRGYEAELLRLKGELLLGRSIPADQEAQGCFREAIELSRRQDAKSLQLRAVTSLSRLLHQQGKDDEARQMLAGIHGWFTEGFDTADLKAAKALLDELS